MRQGRWVRAESNSGRGVWTESDLGKGARAESDLDMCCMSADTGIVCSCLQVLALFAGQPYDSELQDLTNLDSHLTNTCRLEGALAEEEAVRLLSELPEVTGQATAQLHMLC